jgi:2-polyprenyl-3-methyl-5-hydroxy-6-metoxy-1,4-benzoquinol methylase
MWHRAQAVRCARTVRLGGREALQKAGDFMTNANAAQQAPASAIGTAYGNDYLNWKKWGNDAFGTLTKSERSYFSAEIKRLKKTLAKGASVLEIGFGNGSFLKFARLQEWNVSGTEVNVELVNAAKAAGFNAAHAETLADFPDQSFDLVVAFDVLEHIAQDSIVDFMLDVKRVLKPGGHFIARCPNGDSPFGLVNQNGDITHITAIGRGKARYFATKTDMELVYLGGEAEPILGTDTFNMVHRTIGLPIKTLVNICTSAIIYQSNVAFCSKNLTLIYKKHS